MKKYIAITSILVLTLTSCNKVEEKISSMSTELKRKSEEKIKQKITEEVNHHIDGVTNSESADFSVVFPNISKDSITLEFGRKFDLPLSKKVYVFKYKADKNVIIPVLEKQITTNESRSDSKVKKINRNEIIKYITFFEGFIPKNPNQDWSFIKEVKEDKNFEFYKVRRFPNSSTIIYNPTKKEFYHFIEIKE